MGMRCEISRAALATIRSAAAADLSREACGLLLGDQGIDTATVAANVAADPSRHFEIDPTALFAAMRAERAGGPKLLGYWHSHPSGDATPSATDAAMAAPDGKLWLIVAEEDVTAWRATPGGFDRVELSVSPVAAP